MKRKIYLFTNTFPYGCSVEAFLENEMMIASHLDLDILLIPLRRQKGCRRLPVNVSVCNDLIAISILWKIWAVCKLLITRYVWKLFFVADRPRSKKEWFQAIKYLYGALLIEAFLIANKRLFHDNGILYSYWCNHTPLGLCLAREKDDFYKKFAICSRAHGYDVYERLVGTYFPYRKETLKMMDAVYVVSNKGAEYMKTLYPEVSSRIHVSYLGVLPSTEPNVEKQDSIISIISCSKVYPLKRVELIYQSINNYCLENPSKNVKWTHIGDGEGFNNLSRLVENKASNLSVILTGGISNSDVLYLYQRNNFDIFINLSLSEGIPVSIMEAIRFGIPIIGTDVGGNKEIVTQKTGVLIPVDFTQEQFVRAVTHILVTGMKMKSDVLNFYEKNFNAWVNYKKFYHDILSLS